jgi:ribonuclease M5
MELKLSGCPDAGARRLALLKKLDLPEHMSSNAMLQALDLLFTFDELKEFIKDMEIEYG